MIRPLSVAVLFAVGLAAAITVARPPQGTYCTPTAYRDYQVVIGRAAVVKPLPGCTRPALVRKVSRAGTKYAPARVDVGFTRTIWLYTSRLEYTLDGATWRPLVIR